MSFQPIALFLLLVFALIVLPVVIHLSGPPVATLAEYDALKSGMTIAQVQSAIGDPGRETAAEEADRHHKHVYTWTNADGSVLEATFENGQLVAKRHERLR